MKTISLGEAIGYVFNAIYFAFVAANAAAVGHSERAVATALLAGLWVALAVWRWVIVRGHASTQRAGYLSAYADGVSAVGRAVGRNADDIGPGAWDVAASCHKSAANIYAEASKVLRGRP